MISLKLAALAAVVASTSAFTVLPATQSAAVRPAPSVTFMSDEDVSPSDSSSEDLYVSDDSGAINVDSEPYEPTASESAVTSVLDELPVDVTSLDVDSETRAKINEALLKLEALNPTEEPATSPLLNGVWSLRYAGGYSSNWALASPTRQIALFLYSGGYSPGLFALSLAQKLPAALVEVGDLEIS
eukprot:CAMPEP_0113537170 /NCGR_PEP_ID=MMETSP0015_2-20120614/6681_1 /TAXON_ID=2838 /ORGANISM="Odontella" /LENGTH=185 /DNA_ID=CAMNT_0000436643 /DNA_START=85 /DNA_END=638 /DNA_ORIENTATION=- /assembly_acc=CAM_ASM_000160